MINEEPTDIATVVQRCFLQSNVGNLRLGVGLDRNHCPYIHPSQGQGFEVRKTQDEFPKLNIAVEIQSIDFKGGHPM